MTTRWWSNGACRSDGNGDPGHAAGPAGAAGPGAPQELLLRGARGAGAARVAAGRRSSPHADVPVRVVPCVSALAVREALLERADGQWLVVLTDRPDDDLGAGVLSHLVWHRLRTPDPWDAVRLRFAATGVEPALTAAAEDRDIATGLLTAAPPDGWPPAPGGVLTRDHALGAVAAAHLGLTDPVIDATSVLAWTADPAVSTRVADLRALAGDALAGAVLDWAAERAGAAGPALRHLLRAGEARDAVPLGLVAGLLAGDVTGRDGATGPGGADQAGAPVRRRRPGRAGAAVLGRGVGGRRGRDAPGSGGARQRPGVARPRRRTAGRQPGRRPGRRLGPAALRADPPARVAGRRAARRRRGGSPGGSRPAVGSRRCPGRRRAGLDRGWPPTGSRTATRGRRPSTPRCGWRAGWPGAPRPARRPCRRWSAGTATATPGSTRPSATPPLG